MTQQESQRVREAAEHIRSRVDHGELFSTAIILGSGLGGLAERIDDATAIDYHDIPGFSRSTAGGHRGQLICGILAGRRVVAMAGRFHRYEGWSNEQVAFPVHVMHALGAKRLIVSNAAGGVNPKFCVGDLMVIRDHINWLHGGGPLSAMSQQERAQNLVDSGDTRALPQEGSAMRPCVLSETPWRSQSVYDENLADLAQSVAIRGGFTAQQGTYLATLGPTYETRAEYRMMRRIGADVAGMSTVSEVLAATGLGMRILGISLVSNVAQVDLPVKADHQEVLRAGREAAAKMEQIVIEVVNH